MPDANLVTALKMAKGKPMFFAFVREKDIIRF